jgi:iron transport multicopper oxidase
MSGGWKKRWAIVSLVTAVTLVCACAALADGVTYGHDDGRTGWYPEQAGLTPALVSGGSFGQQFSTPVTGQVYAQPLLASGKVLVATEANRAYALDPATGAIAWQRSLGTPFDPSSFCGDLTPTIGVTGTPVVDTTTNTAYMAAKVQLGGGDARYDMHAVNVATGQERPGFPVVIQGAADNAPSQTFAARIELQRPGLLLLGGRVYAAFGGHCDFDNWKGWIVGVDAWHTGQATPGTIASRWVAPATASVPGAGIWQAGSGLMSDGPGRIFAVTGNTYGPDGVPSTPAAASSPPGALGESAIRLGVQSDGKTVPQSFFAPHDAANLDEWDADFAAVELR